MSDRPLDECDPAVWLARADSALALARVGTVGPQVLREDLCFQAQQAVEKALKGLLIARTQDYPKTHDLGKLLTLLRVAGVRVPPELDPAADLSVYAVVTRYPGAPGVTQEDYADALRLAEAVVDWVREQLAHI